MEDSPDARFILDGVFRTMTFEERADALEACWDSLPFYECKEIIRAFITRRLSKSDPSK